MPLPSLAQSIAFKRSFLSLPFPSSRKPMFCRPPPRTRSQSWPHLVDVAMTTPPFSFSYLPPLSLSRRYTEPFHLFFLVTDPLPNLHISFSSLSHSRHSYSHLIPLTGQLQPFTLYPQNPSYSCNRDGDTVLTVAKVVARTRRAKWLLGDWQAELSSSFKSNSHFRAISGWFLSFSLLNCCLI